MTTLLPSIREILECIRSGDWATVEEIVGHIDLTPAKLAKVLDFILEFEFIELDAGKKKNHLFIRSISVLQSSSGQLKI